MPVVGWYLMHEIKEMALYLRKLISGIGKAGVLDQIIPDSLARRQARPA